MAIFEVNLVDNNNSVSHTLCLSLSSNVTLLKGIEMVYVSLLRRTALSSP